MIIVDQSAEILFPHAENGEACLKAIEHAGRNCYASYDKVTEDSYKTFVANLLKRGHETPTEFADMTVAIVTSRAVLAELTRHRLASFCVESQRYIQEAKTGDITFIKPLWYDDAEEDDNSAIWHSTMRMIEQSYKHQIDNGAKPQDAREVLPNSTACRIIMKANLREWRHVFDLRCSSAAYPPMRELMKDILRQAHDRIPIIFDDLYEKYISE